MNYTLHQLQVFLKVSQTGSITKAAQELYLSQPAVSIQLKNFQDQFDIPITETLGKKIYVTDFGKEIALAAERILNEVESISFKTQAFKGLLTGKLRISVASTGKYIMPYFLSGFVKQHKAVEIEMSITNRNLVINSLKKNEVDFSLVSIIPQDISVDMLHIMNSPMYMVISSKNEFIENDIWSGKHLKLPMIYREEGSATRLMMEHYIQSRKKDVKERMVLSSNEAVKQAVLAGLGCSIMSLVGLKNEILNDQIKLLPSKDLPLDSKWYLIFQKGKNLSPVAKSFLKYIDDNKDTIVANQFGWMSPYMV